MNWVDFGGHLLVKFLDTSNSACYSKLIDKYLFGCSVALPMMHLVLTCHNICMVLVLGYSKAVQCTSCFAVSGDFFL